MFDPQVTPPTDPPWTDDPLDEFEGYDNFSARMGDFAAALRGNPVEKGPPEPRWEHAANPRLDPNRRPGCLRCLDKCTRRRGNQHRAGPEGTGLHQDRIGCSQLADPAITCDS